MPLPTDSIVLAQSQPHPEDPSHEDHGQGTDSHGQSGEHGAPGSVSVTRGDGSPIVTGEGPIEEAFKEHGVSAHDDHGGGVGLPQLDPEGSLFVSQLVWLALTFGFLYVMMSRVALPRIATVIEERRDKIAMDLDRAEAFKKKTEEAIAAYEAALADARAKALRTVEETRKKASDAMEEKRKASEAELDKRLREAETRINATKEEALAKVHDVASDAAASIVERLLGETVSGNAIKSAVDAELTQSSRL